MLTTYVPGRLASLSSLPETRVVLATAESDPWAQNQQHSWVQSQQHVGAKRC